VYFQPGITLEHSRQNYLVVPRFIVGNFFAFSHLVLARWDPSAAKALDITTCSINRHSTDLQEVKLFADQRN